MKAKGRVLVTRVSGHLIKTRLQLPATMARREGTLVNFQLAAERQNAKGIHVEKCISVGRWHREEAVGRRAEQGVTTLGGLVAFSTRCNCTPWLARSAAYKSHVRGYRQTY